VTPPLQGPRQQLGGDQFTIAIPYLEEIHLYKVSQWNQRIVQIRFSEIV
jgi:hypothetical protein